MSTKTHSYLYMIDIHPDHNAKMREILDNIEKTRKKVIRYTFEITSHTEPHKITSYVVKIKKAEMSFIVLSIPVIRHGKL